MFLPALSRLSVVASCFLFVAPLWADSFGGGAFDIDFATIGDTTNGDDTTGFGAVDYTYRMSVNEVSEGMISSYNSLSGGPTIVGSNEGPNKPVTNVSWNQAARFVNWLNTSSGFSEAYSFSGSGTNDNILLWTDVQSGYDASNPFRNSEAMYFLPSEDEWYKAAYFDPNADVYYDYATGSNTDPTAVANGIAPGSAVYNGQSLPADITSAGGLSPFGTMGQSGNAWEWIESSASGLNNDPLEDRPFRGGNWDSSPGDVSSTKSLDRAPTDDFDTVGFRVASLPIPEPSGLALLTLGFLASVLRRQRR